MKEGKEDLKRLNKKLTDKNNKKKQDSDSTTVRIRKTDKALLDTKSFLAGVTKIEFIGKAVEELSPEKAKSDEAQE
jgi:hypothetical protein